VYLAEPLGYYKDEGLSVVIAEFAGGSQSIQSVIGGSADVAAGFYEHAIELTAAGKPLQAFVTMLKYPGMALVVSPKASRLINSIEDLKGLRVGVGTPGSPTHFYLNYLLSRHGLSGDAVGVVGIGAPATAAMAIEAGKVDAAVVGAAMIVLQQRVPHLRSAESFRREGVKGRLASTSIRVQLFWPEPSGCETTRTRADASREPSSAVFNIQSHQPSEILDNLPARLSHGPCHRSRMYASVRATVLGGRTHGRRHADNVRRVLSVSSKRARGEPRPYADLYEQLPTGEVTEVAALVPAVYCTLPSAS
jgi:NitT/TauT family transport system substrate-binding protein